MTQEPSKWTSQSQEIVRKRKHPKFDARIGSKMNIFMLVMISLTIFSQVDPSNFFKKPASSSVPTVKMNGVLNFISSTPLNNSHDQTVKEYCMKYADIYIEDCPVCLCSSKNTDFSEYNCVNGQIDRNEIIDFDSMSKSPKHQNCHINQLSLDYEESQKAIPSLISQNQSDEDLMNLVDDEFDIFEDVLYQCKTVSTLF